MPWKYTTQYSVVACVSFAVSVDPYGFQTMLSKRLHLPVVLSRCCLELLYDCWAIYQCNRNSNSPLISTGGPSIYSQNKLAWSGCSLFISSSKILLVFFFHSRASPLGRLRNISLLMLPSHEITIVYWPVYRILPFHLQLTIIKKPAILTILATKTKYTCRCANDNVQHLLAVLTARLNFKQEACNIRMVLARMMPNVERLRRTCSQLVASGEFWENALHTAYNA